jgi:phospholipid transport system substrate-binding protein
MERVVTPLTNRRALLGAVPFLAIVGFSGVAVANDAAAKVVSEVSNRVVELLKTKQGADRQAGFATILETAFDLPLMGQSALGQYWVRASEDQRRRFLKATAAAESRAYAERFGQYGGQTVSIGRVLNRPNGVFAVDSTIVQPDGRPPVRIEWEVQDRGAGFKITDVKVEGVSMVMTRRSDFSSFISRNGGDVEVLIKELEARAK